MRRAHDGLSARASARLLRACGSFMSAAPSEGVRGLERMPFQHIGSIYLFVQH
jgi:hypothetical protein